MAAPERSEFPLNLGHRLTMQQALRGASLHVSLVASWRVLNIVCELVVRPLCPSKRRIGAGWIIDRDNHLVIPVSGHLHSIGCFGYRCHSPPFHRTLLVN